MTIYQVPEGTKVKGVMLISPGGTLYFNQKTLKEKKSLKNLHD